MFDATVLNMQPLATSKLLALLLLFLPSQAHWYIRENADDVPYIPDEYGSTAIEYRSYDQYSGSPILQLLNEGQTVETFDEVILESFVNESGICDLFRVLTGDDGKDVAYTPAVCTKKCLLPGQEADPTCAELAKGRGGGICCPVELIPWYRNRFVDDRMYDWMEMHRPVRLRPGALMMKDDRNTTGSEDYEKIVSKEFQEALVKYDVRICGVLVERDVYGNNPLIINNVPYFCKPKGKCKYDQNRPERPDWHHFCRHNPWYIGDATIGSPNVECCHLGKSPSGSGATPMPKANVNLKTWVFKQIPWTMKYAPGMRSAYACEHYAQYMCDNGVDTCTNSGETSYFRTVAETDYPYVARLGVVAPKVMLFHCLGTIISRRYILSAWDCRSVHGIDTNVVHVGDDGSPRLVENPLKEKVYLITGVVNVYDEWKAEGKVAGNWQVALYRTSKDMHFNAYIRPACLYYEPEIEESKGVFVGLARNLDPEEGSDEIAQGFRWVSLPIRSKKVSASTDNLNCYTKLPYDDLKNPNFARILEPQYNQWGVDSYHTFCAGDPENPPDLQPCEGDLGGPLVVKMDRPYCQWQVVGLLVSTRHNCSRFEYGVFQNVTMFLEAIEDIVWPLPFLDFDDTRPNCGHFKDSYLRPSWNEKSG